MKVDESIPVANDKNDDQDENAAEDIDFAVSLMEECKAELPLSNLDTAVLLFRQVIDMRQTAHPLHTNAVKDLASALAVRFMHTNQIQDLVESFALRRKVFNLDPSQLKSDTNIVRNGDDGDSVGLAKGSLADFQKSTSLHMLNTIISTLQRSLAHLSSAHHRWFAASNTLAHALYARFHHSYDISDLNTAISSLQAKRNWQQSNALYPICVMLVARFDFAGDTLDILRAFRWFSHENIGEIGTPEGFPPSFQFAAALLDKFIESGNMDDLNTTITLIREVIAELPASSEDYAVALNNLASTVFTKFQHGGQGIDLDEAISLHRQALELRLPPHPDRSNSLNNLANSLAIRFEQKGQQIDLDEAISLHRQALELRLPDRSISLNNLASSLHTRFEQGGQKIDLDEAISLNRQALELRDLSHPSRPSSLNNLANSLYTRFQQGLGQQADLDEVISLRRQALELQLPPYPNRSTLLNNLALSLHIRFRQGGQQVDLDDAISLHRQALELRLPPHPDRSVSLTNLAALLATRFEQGGQFSDLDEAISLQKQALELQLLPHPNRSISLNNLASSLHTRFEHGGQRIDLDEAISLNRQALELQLPPHPSRSSSLNTLANSLRSRFQQRHQPADLDEAISLHREALELQLRPHSNRPSSLNNLASALMTRFNQEGQRIDLDEAISLYRQALELHLPPHPNRAGSLYNLASSLAELAKIGSAINLNEAISLHSQAFELRPSTHPSHSDSFHPLGTLLAHPLDGGGQEHLEESMSLFLAATQCQSQSPSRRLRVAKGWAHFAETHQHISAIDAYDAALQALPQVAALSFDIQSRQEALATTSDGLARDASRYAIRSGNLDKAIEFLEAGRSVFWSQVLSLRSPFDQLHDIAPELADKLRKIATELERASYRDVSVDFFDNRKKLSIHSEASRLNRLNEDWVKCIDKVRTLPGFEDFLRPSRLSTLKSAASKHPVIILIANDDGSHCLFMTLTGIHHIPLPNLHAPRLNKLVDLIRRAVSNLPISRTSSEETREEIIELLGEERAGKLKSVHEVDGKRFSDNIFRSVLRVLWDELVKPIINFLDIKKSESDSGLSILQWCPTGHFTFLPIHAAGCYDDESPIECASDYFISSYTPTIGILLARAPVPLSHSTFKMMVVIQSGELSSTKKELENIQRHVSSDALVKFGVPGTVANVETVASCLSGASIVHFACHGKQDRLKPLNSGLKLDDGLLRVSRIMKETIRNGSIAFLCACETAMGDEKLPDEAMSLGASLLFSGFHSVIATMWEMRDEDGPTIADAFYEELFRGPDGKPALEPDTTKSPQALHIAVKKLRSKHIPFRRWVPFIHMGQ